LFSFRFNFSAVTKAIHGHGLWHYLFRLLCAEASSITLRTVPLAASCSEASKEQRVALGKACLEAGGSMQGETAFPLPVVRA